MAINFVNQNRFYLTKKRVLISLIIKIIQKEKRILNSLTFVFCSDEFLLNLNRKFLNHDYYTDILTFDLAGSDFIDGEIYISVDRIVANSKIYNTLKINELHRVMIHGVLHLCGYTDKSIDGKNEMTKKEDYYLKMLANVSRETI